MPPRAKGQSAMPAAASGPHAGQASIRKAYEALGVQHFYASHGARYTNPHEAQIFAAIAQLLEAIPAAVWLGLREPAHGFHNDADGNEDDDDDDNDNDDRHHSGAATAAARGGIDRVSAHTCPGRASAAVGPRTEAPAQLRPSAAPSPTDEAGPVAAAAVVSGLVPPVPLRILDLACGSGEATAALIHWNQRHPIRGSGGSGGEGGPARAGTSDSTYAAGSAQSAPPSGSGAAVAAAHQAPLPGRRQQQARAGAARGPKAAAAAAAAARDVVLPYDLQIAACDPYTGAAYLERTGCPALSWSFEDIAEGCLADWQQQQGETEPEPKTTAATTISASAATTTSSPSCRSCGPQFDLVVCSFALHLCDPSRLYGTCTALSTAARWLAVLAPHKRPHLGPELGWVLVGARRVERTHVRLYRSLRVPAAEAGAGD
ncbi:hypothetical protein PLESTM_001791400 [Pleodorina starrii]|nr:hypothetical protein PLESTM_001791400 [Pleodorina starrii]